MIVYSIFIQNILIIEHDDISLMRPKRIWEICELSDDIKSGTLDLSKFAVEFFSVLQGKAQDIYARSDLFVKKTYLTNNMRHILLQTLRRLTTGEGNASLIL